jgi:hypothetical protein
MLFHRNEKRIVRVRVFVWFNPETMAEREYHEVEERLVERPGNRVPKLPPRRLDVQRRIVQPCRARWRMNRKGRIA